ncbi:MAG: type II toxin-antitoxin system death-on-curing family toxin [Rhodothermales bacterium]|nr:type II toxin-antitoxin system death-on-curing family toxin [Rhodothermales bacterium]
MATPDPIWLSKELVMALQEESLARFGGLAGVRDMTLLESALAKPQHVFAYDEHATIFTLAASYCYGIIKNHAFLDGNKRAGLLATRAFLFLNGYAFVPPEVEAVTMIEQTAAGVYDEAALASWIEACSSQRTSPPRTES